MPDPDPDPDDRAESSEGEGRIGGAATIGGTDRRALARSAGAPPTGALARVGLSGWQYDGWRGDFYPQRLAKRRWLEYVGDRFPTVELNGSFYSLQRPERYQAWRHAVPDGFVFAVKGGRYLTHMLHLRNVHTALANFMASGVLELEDRLGPILWQLPAAFAPTPDVLDAFLDQLPTTFDAARALADDHDAKVRASDSVPGSDGDGDGRSGDGTPGGRVIRHALEVRTPAAVTPDHLAVLRQHRVALVDSDAGTAWPRFDAPTTDFAYLRLHGSPEVYHSGYDEHATGQWAHRVEEHLLAGRDTFVYFDNDAERHAPWDALALDAALAARGAVSREAPHRPGGTLGS
ncbi:DUF72 domain-containing protein [Curtobacterium sp. MCBD17_034]|uniref:DUF72 domain-containing protein n=1 Tax=unclassified Curtobacterium TaxID=257496 RepID=UPI000DA7C6FE|nr:MULTISPECIES: DUF72 domain-containing protein [unclassified Curtobacterium]PZF57506.1 DUF72 domain-containing protein [Curtobacterium sp. MCBD17_034]PZM33597.1 DUF72 domain-containing protein [Curtobacterium sp. MCBD17_031]